MLFLDKIEFYNVLSNINQITYLFLRFLHGLKNSKIKNNYGKTINFGNE